VVTKEIKTPPFGENDKLRHPPFCPHKPPKNQHESVCEQESQNFRLVFRAPDWRVQNGFVLFYEFIFTKPNDEKTKIAKSLSELNAKAAFAQFIESGESKEFCNYIATLEENPTACRKPEKSENITTFEEHKNRIRRDINPEFGSNLCIVTNDPDHCGYRMFQLDESKDTFDNSQQYNYNVWFVNNMIFSQFVQAFPSNKISV